MKKLFILICITFSFLLTAQRGFTYSINNPLIQKIDSTYKVLVEAYTWHGTRYQWGGNTRKGVDCSAFVRNVYKKALDINMPRTSKEQSKLFKKVLFADLMPGDLVFFSKSKGVHHVGIIYEVNLDGVRFIHASSSKGVTISNLDKGYWSTENQKYSRIII